MGVPPPPGLLTKQLVCDTPDRLVDDILSKNLAGKGGTLLDATLTGTLNRTLPTLPRHLSLLQLYLIKGTSETIAQILKPYNIRIQQLLTNVKDRDEPSDISTITLLNIIYKQTTESTGTLLNALGSGHYLEQGGGG